MFKANARLPLCITFTVLLTAGCPDDGATESSTQGTTGAISGTSATEDTGDTTVDVPTSSTGEPTGTTSPVDLSTGPDDTGTTVGPPTGTTSTDTGTTGPTDTTAVGTDTTAESGSTGTGGPDTDTDDTGGDTDDAYGGEWCGNTATTPLVMDVNSVPLRFAPSNGGPIAFAGWVTTTDELRVAIYDIASATWGEPVTLDTGVETSTLSTAPPAAVDGQGNAIVAYVQQEPEWVVRVKRYDAPTAKWATIDLPGDFVDLRIGDVTMTPGGHAVLSAYDTFAPVQDTRPTAWFYDPLTNVWSEPRTYTTVVSGAFDPTLNWAQDPATGDVALAAPQESDKALFEHREAASGLFTTAEGDVPSYPQPYLAAIGGGEFVATSQDGDFLDFGNVYAHRFDGVDWQPTETLGNFFDASKVYTSGTEDGRALVSWSDSKWGSFARIFDAGEGWGELLVANAYNPQAEPAWNQSRHALDGDGFFMAWSSFGQYPGIQTFARRHDGVQWGPPAQLDPQSPYSTRILEIINLGPKRARARWIRDSVDIGTIYVYACHTPIAGWSEPTVLSERLNRVENRPDGAVLVHRKKDGVFEAVYYAPD